MESLLVHPMRELKQHSAWDSVTTGTEKLLLPCNIYHSIPLNIFLISCSSEQVLIPAASVSLWTLLKCPLVLD